MQMKEITKITPYKSSDTKKQQVKLMFDGIAKSYDFLNRFLSLGIDISWRKKALNMLSNYPIHHLLDIATGTGDFAIMAKKMISPFRITAVDLSPQMLDVARKKNGIESIQFVEGDSENLIFESNTFDGATVAFGVRNFETLQKGLKEIHRVLKPGAPFLVLEFSKIEKFPMKQLFYIYSRYIIPVMGKLFSMDFAAYHYLHESMHAFPSGNDFSDQLRMAGFKFVKLKTFSLGICTAYLSEKQ